MKITIPKEYDGHFTKERVWLNLKDKKCCATKEYTRVFISRWKDHSLLLLTKDEHSNLLGSINSLEGTEAGLKHFLEAGIVEVLMQNNVIDIPIDNWLKENNRTFENTDNGLLVR